MDNKDKVIKELVAYPFEVSADERKTFEFRTKPEHKKITGVFLSSEDEELLNDCYVQIMIDNKNVVSYNEIQAGLILKTKYLSIDDVAWQIDMPVNDASIKLTIINNTQEDIIGSLNIIAERNA